MHIQIGVTWQAVGPWGAVQTAWHYRNAGGALVAWGNETALTASRAHSSRRTGGTVFDHTRASQTLVMKQDEAGIADALRTG